VDEDDVGRQYAFATGSDEDFTEMLNRTILRWGINNGRVTREKPAELPRYKPKPKPTRRVRPHKTSKEALENSGKASKERASKNMDRVREMIAWLQHCLTEQTGFQFAGDNESPKAGEFYVKDNLENSRYMGLYHTSDGRKKIGVAMLYPHFSTPLMNVNIAASPEDFIATHRERLKPGVEPGRFKAKLINLDKEGVAIVAELIADLASRGIMGLK
jgi:hypothetical protein